MFRNQVVRSRGWASLVGAALALLLGVIGAGALWSSYRDGATPRLPEGGRCQVICSTGARAPG